MLFPSLQVLRKERFQKPVDISLQAYTVYKWQIYEGHNLEFIMPLIIDAFSYHFWISGY